VSSYPSRRSLRLRGYDYSQGGAYFVTICTESRRCVFGAIKDGQMQLNAIGTMIQRVWGGLPEHYSGLDVDEFVVIPNHLHGILVLACADAATPADNRQGPGRARQEPAPTGRLSLPEIVRRFKTFTSYEYRKGLSSPGSPPEGGTLWQRNFYEHVIRNERDLAAAREYIANNPLQWHLDRENPDV
jgi:putative transposase